MSDFSEHPDFTPMAQMELLDVVLDLPALNPVVVLACVDAPRRVLRFPVGLGEGMALAYALRSVPPPRPLTHELFTTALIGFGISVELVRITGIVGHTLLAEVVLVRQGERHDLECRPSDAIALALRQPLPVPIMVAEEVLSEAADPELLPAPEVPDVFADISDEPPAWAPYEPDAEFPEPDPTSLDLIDGPTDLVGDLDGTVEPPQWIPEPQVQVPATDEPSYTPDHVHDQTDKDGDTL